MIKKKLNSTERKKIMKEVIAPTDKNCMVGVPLQFEVKKDLNIAKKVKAKDVFENYKVNVKKSNK